MKQFQYFGDKRLEFDYCAYCGESTETRDHVVSKVFLDTPYPENLPVIPACLLCNQGFSLDEEYVASLVECASTGSVGGDDIKQEKIGRILERKPALVSRLKQARQESDTGILFRAETERVRNIVLKMARGLAAFELNEPMLDDPSKVSIVPFLSMNSHEREYFETMSELSLWPEVGTRAFQRRAVKGTGESKWINVQQGRYRFLTISDDAMTIRIVIGEYLACEVIWNHDQRFAYTID